MHRFANSRRLPASAARSGNHPMGVSGERRIAVMLASASQLSHRMFNTICQLVGLLGLLACLGLATLGLNNRRKSRQFMQRIFRRIALDK